MRGNAGKGFLSSSSCGRHNVIPTAGFGTFSNERLPRLRRAGPSASLDECDSTLSIVGREFIILDKGCQICVAAGASRQERAERLSNLEGSPLRMKKYLTPTGRLC